MSVSKALGLRVAERARGLVAIAVSLLTSACGQDNPMGPSPTNSCGNGTPVTLQVLQAVTFDCSNGGTAITLDAGGATYLVVPQFATNQADNQPVAYTLNPSTGALAASTRVKAREAVSQPRPASMGSRNRRTTGPGRIQQQFDQTRRAADRQRSRSQRSGATNLALVVQPPVPGSLQDFHVLAVVDTATPVTQRVTAQLDYIGQNILIYVDTLTPSGFTTNQISELGQLFDQTLYPLDLNTFGSPSDIDQNDRVIMLLSPVVNALTSRSACAQGYVAGFFDGFDLVSSDTSANHGEVFYSIAPDPAGTVSCAHSLDNVLTDVPAVFLHELQHLINFSQHVLVHHSVPEEGWLDEGMSLVAQELGSLYYEGKFPPPTGRSNPQQLFPDSAEGFIATQLASSYTYLLQPDTVTLTLHSDSEQGLTWRGGDWLLLRWLGDQKGSGFYQKLEETALTGTANIAAAAGEPFPSLFGDFSLSLYTDSIPGVPRSTIPLRDRFTTRILRTLYQAYFNTAGPSSLVPSPFPITPVSLMGSVSSSAVPGTPTFYILNSSSSASSLELDFTAPGGSALNASLHPQVSVFRLPQPSG